MSARGRGPGSLTTSSPVYRRFKERPPAARAQRHRKQDFLSLRAMDAQPSQTRRKRTPKSTSNRFIGSPRSQKGQARDRQERRHDPKPQRDLGLRQPQELEVMVQGGD